MTDEPTEAQRDHAGSARQLPLSALPWHLVGAVTILLVPSQVRLGQPLWALPPEQTAQVLGMGAGYLALAMAAGFVTGSRARLVVSFAGGVACFGAAYGALTLNPDVAVSRLLVLLSAALGVTLVWAEQAVRRRQLLASGLLGALVVALTVGVGLRRDRDLTGLRQGEQSIVSSRQAVAIHVQQGLVGRPESDGGAVTALSDGYLVVTGDGNFYRLRRDSLADTLAAEPLATVSPLNRDEYLADLSDPAQANRLRATDLLVDTVSNPPRAIVAHQYWNIEEACFTMRISAMSLDSLRAGTGMWQTLYESSPCIASRKLRDNQTGGRLAFDGQRRLLLTVGDHGYDGVDFHPAYPQSLEGDFGKVLAIGDDGARQVVSRGHRNPQGLTVRRDGTIWLTEHGPRGGDEINIVTEGGNYGWPLVTYGTSYNALHWRGGGDMHDHGQYIEPAYAFVPSIGINQVIEVGPGAFPAWVGDLLVASLQGQSLYRVRTRDRRVVFIERIRFDGYRIRDVEQGADGRIILLTDDGGVLSLSAGETSSGQFLYGSLCADCHRPGPGTFVGAPNLIGVVNRPIASTDWPGYSPALLRLEGSWTETMLDAFLSDPDSLAPGNRMQFPGITDAGERQLIIDYLGTRK